MPCLLLKVTQSYPELPIATDKKIVAENGTKLFLDVRRFDLDFDIG